MNNILYFSENFKSSFYKVLGISIILHGIDQFRFLDNFKKCSDLRVHSIHIFHLFWQTCVELGWLISNDLLFLTMCLVMMIIEMISWKIYNDKCIFTEYVNKECGFKDGTTLHSVGYYVVGEYSRDMQRNFFYLLIMIYLYKIKKLK
jgi:hypothetical protein